MPVLLEGHIAALAALEARRRTLLALYLREDLMSREAARLESLARTLDVPVERLPAEGIDALAQGRTHGGVLLRCSPRAPDDASALRISGTPLYFCLEGVEDPYNLGSALRALYAAGVDALLLPSRDWSAADALIARASAGAYDRMPIYALEEPLIEAMSRARVRILLADGDSDAGDVYAQKLTGPLLIAVGGEKRGVSQFVRKRAQGAVRIPYGRAYAQALPASTAAAILAFEAMRARRHAQAAKGARA